MTTLTVVTPWWNHLDLLPDYAAVINAGMPDEVIVIDNGSDPIFMPIGIKPTKYIIQNRTNRGFSRACNQGLMAATSDAVLFMNNDIRLINPEPWVNKIKTILKPGVFVGANMRNDDHTAVDGKIIPYLDGWCLAGMREDFIMLGGWDETFSEPSYYGDNDLCARATAKGFVLAQVDLPIYHLGHTTSDIFNLHEVTPANYAKYAERIRAMRGVK